MKIVRKPREKQENRKKTLRKTYENNKTTREIIRKS